MSQTKLGPVSTFIEQQKQQQYEAATEAFQLDLSLIHI